MRSDPPSSPAAARLQLLRGDPAAVRAPADDEPVLTDPAAGSPPAAQLLLPERLSAWLPPAVADALAGRSLATFATAVTVVLAVVVGGVALLHHHGSAAPAYQAQQSVFDTGAVATPASTAYSTAAGSDAASIVVDVGGRVHHPGLVTLPAGARVADALAAAGGPLRHKEVARLDLAAKVADGQLLLIGTPGASTGGANEASGGAVTTGGTSGPVDLNTATAEQLDALPGVGPVTAQKIIDWRTAHNGFTDVAQLQQVSGIGPVTYNDLKDLVSA